MVLYILEGIAVILWLLVVWTQILVPMWNGTQIFPSFRTRRSQLLGDLKKERTRVEEQQILENIRRAKNDREKLRRRS